MFHNERPLRNFIPAYGSNNCSSLRCEQLCLLNEKHGGGCRCSTGITLDNNHRTCSRDMRRYLLIAKRTMISRVSLDVPYFAEVTMKLNTPYDSLRNLQANLSNVVTVDADISQRTIYWSDTNLKRIFAYQYASSMSSSSIKKQLSKNTDDNNIINDVYKSPLSPQFNQTAIHTIGKMNNKKKDHLGRNMTMIWKNVMGNGLLGKVVGWVSGKAKNLKNNQKTKSTKSKQKQEKLIQKQKLLSKMINNNRISKSAFGLGNVRSVHRVGIGEVNGLVVDVLGRKLYWTDTVRKRIEVSQLNGKQRKILINKNLDSPRALALHHRCGLMFWADTAYTRNSVQHSTNNGNPKRDKQQSQYQIPSNCSSNLTNQTTTSLGKLKPCNIRIERADMDGSKRMTLLNTQLGWPLGITTIHLGTSSSYQYSSYASLLNKQTEDVCSLKNLKVIFIDSKLRTLEMVDLDGSNRKILVKKLLSPYGLASFQGSIWWSDLESKAIYTVNVEQAKTRDDKVGDSLIVSEPRSILSGLNNIVDIRLVNRDELMTQVANGTLMETQRQQLCKSCSDLCLRHSTGYSCACPTGVLLQADQHTCQPDMNTFLLFANKHSILRISMDTDDYNEVYLDLVHLENVVSVDFDYKSKRIYYTDVNLDQIASTNFDGTNLRIHISSNLHTVDGIAIDWVAGNLFFTDTGRDVIEVCRLNGSSRKVLISTDLDEPRAIVVHPVKGVIFWSDWSTSPKIETSFLDGSSRTILVNTDIGWPNGLAIDYEQSRLYWTDAQLDRIESIDFDGQNRLKVISNIMHPYGITVYGSFVYWTDWQKLAVERADKLTGTHRQVIADNIDYLMEIKMVTPSRETESNPCGLQNGGCSHLCLFRPKGYICACGDQPETDGQICSTVPGEIAVDSLTGNRRDLDYAMLDSETDIILTRDGLDEDDEMVLAVDGSSVDSSSETPSQTHLDNGNRPSVESTGTGSDLESKSSVNRELPPIRNIVLTKGTRGHKFNESLECDDEDKDDCTINKFSLEDSFFQLASFISSFAVLLFIMLILFICFIICKSRKRKRQRSTTNSSKSGNSSLDCKLNQKYSQNSSDAIHTLANGHQMINASSLPRDSSKWEKKKIRALNQQRKGSLDSSRFILAGQLRTIQTPSPPPAPNQTSIYPLPLLSLPDHHHHHQITADIFDNQQELEYFNEFNSLHHRHHLHLHQNHQHLIDSTTNPTSFQETITSTNPQLILSTLNSNTLPKNNLISSSLFQQPTLDHSYLFSASTADPTSTINTCSHCSYELYDCHNLIDNITTDLMILPNYHQLAHLNSSNQYEAHHQCPAKNEFSWSGYNTINDSLDYHQNNLNKTTTVNHSTNLAIGSLVEEEQIIELNEENDGIKSKTQTDDNKSNEHIHHESNEEHNTSNDNTIRQAPRLERTQTFDEEA